MNINISSSSSVVALPLNKLPTTGILLRPGVAELELSALSILIPPITTISPSVIKSFVSI